MELSVEKSVLEDRATIFELYHFARQYQTTVFPDNVWPIFDNQMVLDEINNQQQWKILVGDTVACVWAITSSDPLIWDKKDTDAAIYIHRIATNPEYRGYNFVSHIVNWAKSYAKTNNVDYIRLDTCGYNKRLIAHYKKCGFRFIGTAQLENSVGLPEHYHNADVCYFEIKL